MNLHKYTVKQLRDAVSTSLSYRQTLIKLGVVPSGGNYRTVQKAVKYFNIDNKHFTGQAWNKGRTYAPKRSISDYLSNRFPIQSHKLRKRLLKEQIFDHQCDVCKRKTWMKQSIPLELDHIDGQHQNNSLSNLRLLCPNCHAQTSNYRGKNIGKI